MIKRILVTQNQKGISLIETIISISVILVMSASFYELLTSFYQNYEVQEAIAETQQQGRVTADLFWQEIRNTGLDPTGGLLDPDNENTTKATRKVACVVGAHPVEPIFEATPTIFHFLADLNQNGEINGDDPVLIAPDPEEQIRYEWVGGSDPDDLGTDPDFCGTPRLSYTLYRDSGGGMQGAAANIVAFNLEYYDEDGVQLPQGVLDPVQRSQIRRVVVNLTARTENPVGSGYRTRDIRTVIWLRNL